MPIFRYHNGKLKKLSVKAISTEKELQSLIEANSDEVLGMYFLESEYVTTFGGRIDTLAVDYNGSPVIIEYKKNRNDNVINQALSYLRWLQAQKKEFFEMLIIKKLGNELAKKLTVDWKNPRVICIAESYSKFDIDTVEVIPMRIELFKYRYYDDGIFALEPLGVSEQKSQSSISNTSEKNITDNYIDDFLIKASDEVKIIFQELRERIFSLDENIKEKCTKFYVCYRITKNFAEVHIGKNQLRIHLRPVDYNDPRGFVSKVPDSYQWTLNRKLYLKKYEDIEYVFSLIEQSYKDVL